MKIRIMLDIEFEGSMKDRPQLIDELQNMTVVPYRTGHDDEGIRIFQNTSIATVRNVVVAGEK